MKFEKDSDFILSIIYDLMISMFISISVIVMKHVKKQYYVSYRSQVIAVQLIIGSLGIITIILKLCSVTRTTGKKQHKNYIEVLGHLFNSDSFTKSTGFGLLSASTFFCLFTILISRQLDKQIYMYPLRLLAILSLTPVICKLCMEIQSDYSA